MVDDVDYLDVDSLEYESDDDVGGDEGERDVTDPRTCIFKRSDLSTDTMT